MYIYAEYTICVVCIGKSEESLKVQQVIVETLEQLAKDNGLDTTATTEEGEKEVVSEGEVMREAEYNNVSVVQPEEGQEGSGKGVKEEVVVTKVTSRSAHTRSTGSSIRKDKDDDNLNFPLL